MQIVCKDGTTIPCRDFEAIDSGVLLFQETADRQESESEDEEEEERERSAAGFVPITELRFVLPDEMVQRGAAGQQARAEAGRGAVSPQRQQTQPGGQMSQQQQMQQQPGTPQPPYETGGQ